MSLGCTYIWRGKKYSKDRILRAIVNDGSFLLSPQDQTQSIQWLQDKLGLSDAEIQIVSGLIDNTSLGRFLSDGRILLSNLSSSQVAYHEAFHRVWRMYLDNSQRKQVAESFKRRKNWKDLIEPLKERYPNNTEQELIEEYLADEFSDFTLNPEGYKIEQPTKSFFQKLLDFIKSMLGLKSMEIYQLYRDIENAKFKSKEKSKQPYQGSADSILIGNRKFTADEKNLIVRESARQLIQNIIGDNIKTLEDVAKGKKTLRPAHLYFSRDGVASLVATKFLGRSEEIALALAEDRLLGPTGSQIYSEVLQHLNFLGIEVVASDVVELEDTNDTNKREEGWTDQGFNTQIEIDPKSNLSKQIKILLGSFYNERKNSKFGFPEPVSWSKAFIEIAETMAGVPSEDFMDVLKESNISFKNQLLKVLEGDQKWNHIFRNDFITNLSKTINTFNIMNIEDGMLYFFNANENTKANKLIKVWENALVSKFSKDGVFDIADLKNRVNAILKANIARRGELVSEQLGIQLSDEILDDTEVKNILSNILSTISRYTKDTLEESKMFEKNGLDIKGNIIKLALRQSSFEESVDMMVNAMGKQIYGLGLNNQVTLMINRINFAIGKFTNEMSDQDKLEILKKYVPHIKSRFFLNQKGEVASSWLTEILKGNKLKLTIVYNVKNDVGEEDKTSNLDEPDLLAMHLNGALQGVTMSLKHSDRSIFYAFGFEGSTSPLVDPELMSYRSPDQLIDHLTEYYQNQIINEIEYEKEYLKQKQGFQNFEKAIGSKPGLSEVLGVDRYKELLKSDSVKLTPDDISLIRKQLNDGFQDYINYLKKWEVITGEKPTGLNKELISKYRNNINLAVATAYVNEVINHIEELKFLVGDARFYKDPVDLFKRLAAKSSTGLILVNDQATNDLIKKEAANNRFTLLNPRTGKVEEDFEYPLAPDGFFRSVTLFEKKDYKSSLLDKAISSTGKPVISKLTGQNESKIFMIFETNLLKDYERLRLSLDESDKKRLTNKIKDKYEKAYAEVNENDGQSWMNIVAFKNYMIRLGKWTRGMDNVFKAELQVLNAKSLDEIKDITIELNGRILKPFEIKSNESFKERKSIVTLKKDTGDINIEVEDEFDAFHTLKTQYAGFTIQEEYKAMLGEIDFWASTIFKTAQHIVIPSAVIGTNLQQMNYFMLKNGVDIIPMGSANKVGGVDPKMVSTNPIVQKNGLQFYDENGYFNDEVIEQELDKFGVLADVTYFKDQVSIGNKVKSEIKGSTQSLKIMLSNLIVNGQERFEGAAEIATEYRNIINKLVKEKAEKLLKELEFNTESNSFSESRDALKKVLMSSQQAKSAPENIINSIVNFIEDPVFETLPNKSKIENILYSIVTNRAISFDRPGNSYPQVASTGYEELGTRRMSLDKTTVYTNDEALNFYDVQFDEDGNITKVTPAEIMIPLPTSWVEPVLKLTGTKNIVEGISKLNSMIERGELDTELTFKGLRIPNQQLSSNDVLRVKKFFLPTAQSYVVVPSELVVKVGSD